MITKAFFDPHTSTLTYVVYDPKSKDAIVIDPVLDYTPGSSTYSTESVDKVDAFIQSETLHLHFILETHAHADHLTGAQVLKSRYPHAKIAIGRHITLVQKTFKHVFNFKEFNENGVQFDLLLNESEKLVAGSLSITTLFTPGHTPACSSYLIDNALFTGDALFMHDYGTGRCDFPGGDSGTLYDSIQKIYALPDDTLIYVCHDYQPNGRKLAYRSSVKEQKEHNPQLSGITCKEDFVRFRDSRDSTLKAPTLLLQSLQVNIDAGHLPKPEDNGTHYLKIPIKKI
jgi:glyoxylase-like metal-dependent hydrolase (beta-lactamase superfamily II)